MNRLSQVCKAYSTDTQDRVEQYFHIAEVLGQTKGSGSKQYIVLVFSRYQFESLQRENKTQTWHGPFPSIRAAKALIRSRKAAGTTEAAARGAGQEL